MERRSAGRGFKSTPPPRARKSLNNNYLREFLKK